MSDRELLQLAAKAAGVVGEYECWAGQGFIEGIRQILNGSKCYRLWNPLTDDGDALRLAVALNLTVVFHPALNQVLCRPYHTRDMGSESREDAEKHADPYAATRRAIVRAAAAIGAAI